MWSIVFLVVVIVFSLAIKYLSIRFSPKKIAAKKQLEINYRSVPSLITDSEKSFLAVLDNAIGAKARVFCMVRVADVLKPASTAERKHKHTLFLKTSQKHFDFVVCEPLSLEPLFVIELNDRSHQRKDRKDRDAFLKQACESAKLPLLFIPVSRQYDVSTIRSQIDHYLPEKMRKVS